MRHTKLSISVAVLFTTLGVTGCGGGGGGDDTEAVTVQISPTTKTIATGATAQFTATVSGATDTSVTWSVQETAGCGSVSAAGLYTAPSSSGTCHVVAKSVADATKTAVATVTVTSTAVVSITISPTTATVQAGQTKAFTATVTGTTNTTVTWAVQETSGCGAVSSTGVYTAPSAAGTCHVVAKSAADTTKTAAATVTVTAGPAITVSLVPTTATVFAGERHMFAANVSGTSNNDVTWAIQEASGCGSITADGYYTAPDAATTCHVVASSVAAPTATGTAVVTVAANPFASCQLCHKTPPAAPHLQTPVAYCVGCHDTLNADGTLNTASGLHQNHTVDAHAFAHPSTFEHMSAHGADPETCKICHGADLTINCNTCHAVKP